MAPFYSYPTSNSDLIDKLELVEHFEGGFFKQTEVVAPGAPVIYSKFLAPI
jgi:predicted cupin superfamily sugar epimerase